MKPSGYSDTFLISKMALLIVKNVWIKVVNGYGKFTQPKTDSFGPNMIGCSISSDRQSIP